MSDFSSGAIVDDDLDFSAAQNRAKGQEAAGAKAVAWGGRGLSIAIGVSAAVMVAGIALWAMQFAGGMCRPACAICRGASHHVVRFVGLSAGGPIIVAWLLWHRRFRRHLQGGRRELHRQNGGRHRPGGGGATKLASACGAVRLLQPVALMVTSSCWAPTSSFPACTFGPRCGPTPGRFPIPPCASSAWWRLWRCAFRDRLIFGLQQGREMWHTALLAPWFVSSALVCGTALVMVIAALPQGRLSLARPVLYGEAREAPRRLRDGGSVLLRLRSAAGRFPRRPGARRWSC